MIGKVVHLPRSIHRRAKEHCENHDLPLTRWVAGLIAKELEKKDSAEIQELVVDIVKPELEPEPEPVLVPVSTLTLIPVKKIRMLADLGGDGADPVSIGESLPFWLKRKQED